MNIHALLLLKKFSYKAINTTLICAVNFSFQFIGWFQEIEKCPQFNPLYKAGRFSKSWSDSVLMQTLQIKPDYMFFWIQIGVRMLILMLSCTDGSKRKNGIVLNEPFILSINFVCKLSMMYKYFYKSCKLTNKKCLISLTFF